MYTYTYLCQQLYQNIQLILPIIYMHNNYYMHDMNIYPNFDVVSNYDQINKRLGS